MTVQMEAKVGAGYTKMKEHAVESGNRAGILWMKKRVYAVMWEKEGEVGGMESSEEGDKEYGGGGHGLGSRGGERQGTKCGVQ